MSETTEARVRAAALVYFPMFIATLSLITSIYNGYLNGKFVDSSSATPADRIPADLQGTIDAYFQAKMRIGLLASTGAQATAAAQSEAAAAVMKVGALGTYLANLRDEKTRERYTHLTTLLDALARDAPRLSGAESSDASRAPIANFSDMNADCVRTAKDLPQ